MYSKHGSSNVDTWCFRRLCYVTVVLYLALFLRYDFLLTQWKTIGRNPVLPTMSRLVFAIFVVAILVLAFNYYSAVTQNAEAFTELSRIKLRLQEGNSMRLEALKKWQLCQGDLASARDAGKKLGGEVKKHSHTISDRCAAI